MVNTLFELVGRFDNKIGTVTRRVIVINAMRSG